MLLGLIKSWQDKAKQIAPPEGTGISPARGGLPGPAFFPEGLGLQDPRPNAGWPRIMAIGHNFGCEAYLELINRRGREDDKATWHNLRSLLEDADLSLEYCFMTNWFVGLIPGKRQKGRFLAAPNCRYEAECRELLLRQISGLKPRMILLLGLPVVSRAYEIMPTLQPWAGAKNWRTVDTSSLGCLAYNVDAPGQVFGHELSRFCIRPLRHPISDIGQDSFQCPTRRPRWLGKHPTGSSLDR